MEGYKDLKFSTIAKKLEEYLKEQNLNDIPLKEFENRLEEAVNAFMKANHYPLHCVIGDVREIDLLMENGKKAAEIRVRYDLTRKKSIRDRKYYFKSLVKTGPCFDRKLRKLSVAECWGSPMAWIRLRTKRGNWDILRLTK